MRFIEIIERARALLERNGRLSLRALKREFDLADEVLDELVDELVDVQQVVAREGKILAWVGPVTAPAAPVEPASGEATFHEEPEPPRREPEGERRQLTVLFCDLVDSTRLAAGMDPEDWRELVRGYQEVASEVIARFDGHVAQYLGDGLLVYFGWPRAHEDDAERAIRAGREILTRLAERNEGLEHEGGPALSARIGVHTGPVVMGELHAGRETLAHGDTVNLAARIQSLAKPDTLVISPETLRLVRGIFVTEDLGPQTLKGVGAPVTVHRVIQPSGVRSRLDVAGTKLTRFVGREREIGLLIERWEQALEGDGHTVLISGEPGLGKSRLVLRLRERLAEEPHTWLECRCSPYTEGSALRPVIELVEQGLAFTSQDTPETKLRKLEEGVELSRLSRQETVPLIGPMLGIPVGDGYAALELSPELQRERTLAALATWTLALGEIQPVLLLVEDLRWCDPSSLELFGRLLEQIPASRVLMLLTTRPEFEPPWSLGESWTPIVLGRLRKRQARELVAATSPGRVLPAATVEAIVERAGGVPLYLEELSRAVLESGLLLEREGRYELECPVAELAIPTTLRGSLMARLDRLSAAKEVAQLAAPLGREFPYRLLASVAELDEPTLRQGLDRLVGADLLFRRGSPPDAIYTFKHALIQETAYQSLLKTRRQEIHARIARTLEESFPAVATSEPSIVAHHFAEAGQREKAAAYYTSAGEMAQRHSAHREAIAHFGSALDSLATLEEGTQRNERELALQIGLGASLQAAEGYSSENARKAYDRARSLCDHVRDPDRLAFGLWGLSAYHLVRGDLDTCAEVSAELCRNGESSGEPMYRLAGEFGLAAAEYFRGDSASSLEHGRAAIAAYERSRGPALVAGYAADLGINVRGYTAWALWSLGYPDQAGADAEEGVRLAKELNHAFTLAFALVFSSAVHVMRRDPLAMAAWASQAISLSEAHGIPLYLGCGRILQAWSRAGEAGAVEEVQQGVALAGGTGNQLGLPIILGIVADVHEAAGRRKDAVNTLDLALEYASRLAMHFWDAKLLCHKGDLLLQMGGSQEEAQALYVQAVEVARSQRAKSLELRAANSLARLWRDQDRSAEARALLQPVYDWFAEGFDTKDLKDAKALLEELT